MKKTVAATQNTSSKGLQRFLYLTAAINGGIILIIEILGAKMLSPYFGTSHFVWTAQIAVTLLSLACGYYFGGWLADRYSKLDRLYFCILIAGIYLSLAVVLLEPVAYWCLKYKLAFGSVLAALFLFFVPLTLLATTVPFLIRFITQSMQNIGSKVGLLSAVSTVGSVLGTILIGYVLIPFAPNSVTMLLTVSVLLAQVVIFFIIWRKRAGTLAPVITGVVISCLIGLLGIRLEEIRRPAGFKELARRNSNFGLMQVMENSAGTTRYYRNDYLTQNSYDPQLKKSRTVFTYMLYHLAHAYREQIQDVLCIGLGIGIVPMDFARDGARVEVAEINPRVVSIGEDYFDLKPEQLNITIGDGRHYLNETKQSYDVIVLDAFLGDSSPSHLMTQECFESMRARLNPEGLIVINSFGRLQGDKDFFMTSLHKTLKSVFEEVRVHDSGFGNIFFVASDHNPLAIVKEPNFESVHPELVRRVRNTYDNVVTPSAERGIVLTDDYNPVEFYDAAMREEIRRDLALSMRRR